MNVSYSCLVKVEYAYIECFSTPGWTCYAHDLTKLARDFIQDVLDIQRRRDDREHGHDLFSSMRINA